MLTKLSIENVKNIKQSIDVRILGLSYVSRQVSGCKNLGSNPTIPTIL